MDRKSRSVIPGWIYGAARAVLRRLAIHGNVVHGKNFRVGRAVIIGAPHHLHIGDNVSVGPRTVIQVNGSIGDYALIGMHVQIIGREDHEIVEVGVPMSLATWVGDREPRQRDSVEIGRDVWIGASSVILGGVSIGEGSIVGAGSVVTRDVPKYSIVAGNPARVIRRRFQSRMEEDLHSQSLSSTVRPK